MTVYRVHNHVRARARPSSCALQGTDSHLAAGRTGQTMLPVETCTHVRVHIRRFIGQFSQFVAPSSYRPRFCATRDRSLLFNVGSAFLQLGTGPTPALARRH